MPNTIILMPHPRAESAPPGGHAGQVPWNVADHRRKFLECAGSYLAALPGPEDHGVLRFWCEYEPPTYATPIPKVCAPPMWLHTITQSPTLALQQATPIGECSPGHCAPHGVTPCLQNTDPWIWRDGFVWTICRHHRNKLLLPVIRALGDGDLVLFGSPTKSEWLLDTVLVVDAPGPPQPPGNVLAHNSDRLYATCVLDRLSTNYKVWRPIPGRRWRSSRPDAPFSFVPAVVGRDDARFQRPDISSLLRSLRMSAQPGRPPSTRANQSLTRCTHPDGVLVFWRELVKLVMAHRLVLGTHLDFPAIVQA